MKLLINTLLFLTSITTLHAQKLEVKYQERVKINNDEFKNAMKVETTGNVTLPKDFYDNIIKSMSEPQDYLLTIFDNESLYKKVEKISNSQGNGGFSMTIGFNESGSGYFKNLTTKEYSKTANLMDKAYVVKDKLKDYKWQLSRETKKIIGFDVKKATAIIDSTTTVIAWYATSIAVKDGPATYNGLPGLILEIERKNSKDKGIESNIISAIEVKETPEMKPIDKPKEKNVISEKEYKELSKKQMERYNEMYSEGVDKKD